MLRQLLGPLDAVPSVRRQASGRRRGAVAAESRPDEVEPGALGKEAKETDQQMTVMWKLLTGLPDKRQARHPQGLFVCWGGGGVVVG